MEFLCQYYTKEHSHTIITTAIVYFECLQNTAIAVRVVRDAVISATIMCWKFLPTTALRSASLISILLETVPLQTT